MGSRGSCGGLVGVVGWLTAAGGKGQRTTYWATIRSCRFFHFPKSKRDASFLKAKVTVVCASSACTRACRTVAGRASRGALTSSTSRAAPRSVGVAPPRLSSAPSVPPSLRPIASHPPSYTLRPALHIDPLPPHSLTRIHESVYLRAWPWRVAEPTRVDQYHPLLPHTHTIYILHGRRPTCILTRNTLRPHTPPQHTHPVRRVRLLGRGPRAQSRGGRVHGGDHLQARVQGLRPRHLRALPQLLLRR